MSTINKQHAWWSLFGSIYLWQPIIIIIIIIINQSINNKLGSYYDIYYYSKKRSYYDIYYYSKKLKLLRYFLLISFRVPASRSEFFSLARLEECLTVRRIVFDGKKNLWNLFSLLSVRSYCNIIIYNNSIYKFVLFPSRHEGK